jgi:hypothetical protein
MRRGVIMPTVEVIRRRRDPKAERGAVVLQLFEDKVIEFPERGAIAELFREARKKRA